MREMTSRAVRIRRTQFVAAGTVVAACSVLTVIAFGMPAAANSAGRSADKHRLSATNDITAPATAGGPTTGTSPTAAPTRAANSGPPDSSGVSALAASGIPQVALNAYRVAAARLGHAQPSCGIEWYLLAGIGRVESDHGQFGGSVLHTDGVSTPAIIGPALNGKGNQLIPAPANGLALDGDATYAHALGPMQFIPSTWAGWGADANGDGRADIFNINDAALGAARYLCAAGGDLRVAAGQSRAVLAYNHLTSYRNEVLALADAYRRGSTPTAALIGNTTGSLPGTGHTGALPPATAGASVATTLRRPGNPGTSANTGTTHPTRTAPVPTSSRASSTHSSASRTPSPSCAPSSSPSSTSSSGSTSGSEPPSTTSSTTSSTTPSTTAPSTTAPSSPSGSTSGSASCAKPN